jgi:hypothetical protein
VTGVPWSYDFHEFARQVVWFDSTERRGEKYPFLAFLMAKGSRRAYEHARKVFDFTDEDFREALRQAKPGLFLHPDVWNEWNIELGIIPPWSFPKQDLGLLLVFRCHWLVPLEKVTPYYQAVLTTQKRLGLF